MDTAVHDIDPTPEPPPRPSTRHAPQLRTLLLTDLVDSTGLVERLGDGPASDLFRAHDRLVLQLQQQWRGRLIDRSDGLLLLFERPIDGLGFALDYTRGLIELGRERNIDLRARAGLHVGEVLTWRNSDEAVSVGAKPLEVEGLAKPMAARLMSMARPGQILISAVAEPLAHRAARELGERGQHLAWKSWGRWRFKGVPEQQHIFEVGEPGIAPLRMPPNTPKAWRDIPLWRRPAALAAEVALLVGGAIGLWFIAKPEPAIAFNQRDWVVVGDLRNLTGQSQLDDSLEQAFRISLEQSRHVNVLSDLKARDTLGRMRRPPGTVLDRAIASEIAIRDGARAVILPTVAEVGGHVRVSAEVIDPHTQTTVYAESADGRGFDSALGSIDKVTASLRGKLGEAVRSIEKDSTPLPQVTTRNLDALRAYALGQKAYSRSAFAEALQMFESATRLDPNFALAWMGQMRVHVSRVDAPRAIEPLRKAQALREHLAAREAMYLDAWAAQFDSPSEALAKWLELTRLYPDYFPGQANAALGLYYQNRLREGLPFAKSATASRYELASTNFDTLGRLQLGLNQYSLAARSFDQATKRGYRSSLRRRASVEAAQRRFAEAEGFLGKVPRDDRNGYLERTSVAIDRAHWAEAQMQARTGLNLIGSEQGLDARSFLVPMAVSDWLSGKEKAALTTTRDAAFRAVAVLGAGYDADAEDDAAVALASSMVAQRLGDQAVAARVLEVLEQKKELMRAPALNELAAVVRAESLRARGEPRLAIEMLRPLLSGSERYQTRVSLMSAYADAQQYDMALEQSRWLQQHRGLAYIELNCSLCLQALNVADSNLAILSEAELLERLGKTEESERALAHFDSLWPKETLSGYLRARRLEVDKASRLGVVWARPRVSMD